MAHVDDIKSWDDKFGWMAYGSEFVDLVKKRMSQDNINTLNGVGKDAEIITNANGGKQSKSPMAIHLIDPDFLFDFLQTAYYSEFIDYIVLFMKTEVRQNIINAIKVLNPSVFKGLITIGEVLQYGAERYEANNWRLIPQEEHINHALIHYIAYKLGDMQDNHLEHCMCRLMMAYATEPSEGFSYTKYITKNS